MWLNTGWSIRFAGEAVSKSQAQTDAQQAFTDAQGNVLAASQTASSARSNAIVADNSALCKRTVAHYAEVSVDALLKSVKEAQVAAVRF